jgi:uncharacterized protein (DUF433 family)
MAVLRVSGPQFLAERCMAESPLVHGSGMGIPESGDGAGPALSIVISLSPWRDWQQRLEHVEQFLGRGEQEIRKLRSRYQATQLDLDFPLHRSHDASEQLFVMPNRLLNALGSLGIDLRLSYLPPDFSGSSERHPRIVIDPLLCQGKPVIRGTKVLVRNLVDALASNQTLWQIRQDFPDITAEDVVAAAAFINEQAERL